MNPLLNPKSVAILGASDNPDKIGGRPIRFMREFGFAGTIYPVNPGRDMVQGLKSYPSLADLPEAPEAVIVAVAGDAVEPAVAECARIGVKLAVIMASGFGETGPEGKATEARMRATAHAAGMRLIGPNSQGVANFGSGAILSFSTMFVETPPMDGPVASISQSGGMSVVPYGLLRDKGIGLRYVNATGNDCDISAAEMVSMVLDDPEIRLILLYIENLADPEAMAQAAIKARNRGVPIVALKPGESETGKRAAESHTGAIATSHRVVEAFFRKYGIWRARGTRDLVHAAEMYLHGWQPSGENLAVISNSGAVCVLASDAAEREGLKVPALTTETEAKLTAILPAFASPRNPVDITAALLSNSGLFGEALPVAGSDPNVDMFLVGLPVTGQGYDYPRFARDTGAFLKASGKPTAVANIQPHVRAVFRAEGVPAFDSEDDAVAAMAQFAHHHRLMREAAPAPFDRTMRPAGGKREVRDEFASLSLLDAAGIATPRRVLCGTAEEAIALLADVPAGIVLKACSGAIPHKSDHGLVRVGLRDADAVRAAWAGIRAALERIGHPEAGMLAAEMIPARHEMIVGGHHDPHFGPVVVIGDGGIAVEAMPDNQLLLPPFSDAEVHRALDRLRIAPLFRGFRGQGALDADAVARAAQGVARLLREDPAVASVEVNPLMVAERGAWAVDALVEVVAEEEVGLTA
ncbi:pimeloyl-CoA synthetase [Primorskyibacter flagellatus]|uniref:Pimeloyl-CoA synthetase n=1 Tax=Primorskyibacter flagellatus TaxID=1387277 RepID=A0A917A524_9RHOB|nr:acetate--CoA ligase family protein [Primorskyibacter flagellatus]GGE27676.1 pimeloyl-CoA synthetase [Primorskyibacter flagellatus]